MAVMLRAYRFGIVCHNNCHVILRLRLKTSLTGVVEQAALGKADDRPIGHGSCPCDSGTGETCYERQASGMFIALIIQHS